MRDAPIPPGSKGPSRRYYIEELEGDRWVARNFMTRYEALWTAAELDMNGHYNWRIRARLNNGKTLVVLQ